MVSSEYEFSRMRSVFLRTIMQTQGLAGNLTNDGRGGTPALRRSQMGHAVELIICFAIDSLIFL